MLASLGLWLTGCTDQSGSFQTVLPSPDSQMKIYFSCNDGELYYLVMYKEIILVGWSEIQVAGQDDEQPVTDWSLKNKRAGTNFSELVSATDSSVTEKNVYNDLELVFYSESTGKDIIFQLRAYKTEAAFICSYDLPGKPENKVRTDITLYNKNTIWNYTGPDSTLAGEDILSLPDTIILPAVFQSDSRFSVTVYPYHKQDELQNMLLSIDPETATFRYASGNTYEKLSGKGTENEFWQVIRVAEIKNKQTE